MLVLSHSVERNSHQIVLFSHQSTSVRLFNKIYYQTRYKKKITKFKDEMRERSRVRGIKQISNEASRKQCFAGNARNRKVGVRGRQGQVIGCLTLRKNRVRNRLHFWWLKWSREFRARWNREGYKVQGGRARGGEEVLAISEMAVKINEWKSSPSSSARCAEYSWPSGERAPAYGGTVQPMNRPTSPARAIRTDCWVNSSYICDCKKPPLFSGTTLLHYCGRALGECNDSEVPDMKRQSGDL